MSGMTSGGVSSADERGTKRRGGRVELVSLTKSYGTQLVLKGIDLTIESGEFFSLLGPSGCGKTTTLRLIGGFEDNEIGSVLIDGVNIAGVPPERRPVNTVFQNYALFPHMSVAENVGFGLRFQEGTKDERRRRVGEALDLVRLGEYAERRPHQLSGGQQQRVALARALVLRPRVLLLDEPLGALDAKLRRALQFELKELHREVGITFVYVTHDQEEALTMSDRLAVMRQGEIEQVGPPQDVYDRPESTYVADFLGLANLLPANVPGEGRVEALGLVIEAPTAGGRRAAARSSSGRNASGSRRSAREQAHGHGHRRGLRRVVDAPPVACRRRRPPGRAVERRVVVGADTGHRGRRGHPGRLDPGPRPLTGPSDAERAGRGQSWRAGSWAGSASFRIGSVFQAGTGGSWPSRGTYSDTSPWWM